jgi:hypothetical protein
MTPQRQDSKRTFALVALAVMSILVVSVLVLVNTQPAQSSQVATLIPASAGSDGVMIKELSSMLNSRKMSDEDRKSLETKLEMAERLAAQRQVDPSKRGPKPAAQPINQPAELMSQSNEPIQDEVLEGSEGLIRPSEATVLNLWQGERNGLYYQVFAGATVEDQPQSMVIMVQTNLDQSQRKQQTYLAPQNIGALRVVEVKDMRVTLSGENGGQVVFNLESQSFE